MNTTTLTSQPPAIDANDVPEATLLLTLDEVAQELRCARRSVERQIADHRLPVVRFGRCVRVARTDLEAFVADLRDPADKHRSGRSRG